jgi:predicted permease
MDTAARFIVFQALIVVPFGIGMTVRRADLKADLPRITKRLVNINLVFLEPVTAMWSIWGIGFTPELAVLPLAGLALVTAGLCLGWAGARVLGIRARSGATFQISSSLANHGFTMGSFLCYLVLGERGLGLSSIFMSYFMPFVFLVIFPYARARGSARGATGQGYLRDFIFNLQNMPLYSTVAAVALLALGVRRPNVHFPVDAFIMTSMGLYYLTLGMNFEMSLAASSVREHLSLAAVKFMILPCLCMAVLAAFDLDPGIEAVIMMQSFMPAAIYSVVASVLFDLDTGLASSMFVVNTLVFIVVVLPVLWYGRGLIYALIT